MIAQTPLAQSRIQLGGEVSVVLSTGAAHAEVPPLVGQTLERCQEGIEAAGLKLGQMIDANEGEPGTVIASCRRGRGGSIRARRLRSRSRAQASPLPKLSAVKVARARSGDLRRRGSPSGDVSEIYNEHKRGNLVLTQDPEGGAMAPPGTKVTWSSTRAISL